MIYAQNNIPLKINFIRILFLKNNKLLLNFDAFALVLNLIKANPEKISVNRKRNKCAMSDAYREKMLGF